MEDEKPAIRQLWLEFVHSLADSKQIASELTIVERADFHLDHLPSPLHTTWQAKKRLQTLPGRMRIGGRKEAVTDPHRQVRQCELAHSHNLIFVQGFSQMPRRVHEE